MTDIDNISRILFAEPDYMGFIFYPQSPRYVVGKLKPEMLSILPDTVKKAGVFVNASESEVRQYAQQYDLDIVQLHGQETPEQCEALRAAGYEVTKAFSIKSTSDFESVQEYSDVVDYFLFDAKTENYEGTGKSFDWQLLLRQPLRKRWFISGGIGPHNIVQASQTGAWALDLNSCFEVQPGIKDYEKLQAALAQLRKNK